MIALNNPQLPQFTAEDISFIQEALKQAITDIKHRPFYTSLTQETGLIIIDRLENLQQKLHLYWNAAVKESNEAATHKAGAISPAARAYKLAPKTVARFYTAGSVSDGWRLHDKKTDIWYSFDTHMELNQKIINLENAE